MRIVNNTLPASLANIMRILPPVSNGLIGFWVLGTTLAISCRNFADPANPAVPYGDWTGKIADHYITTKGGTRGLVTPFFDTPDITIMAIAQSTGTGADGDNKHLIVGTSSGQATGINLSQDDATHYGMNSRLLRDSDSLLITRDPVTPATDMDGFKFLIAKGSNTVNSIYNMTNSGGNDTTEPSPATRLVSSTGKIAIGGNVGATLKGEGRIAAVAIYNRVTTTDEDTAMYTDYFKAWMAEWSLTI